MLRHPRQVIDTRDFGLPASPRRTQVYGYVRTAQNSTDRHFQWQKELRDFCDRTDLELVPGFKVLLDIARSSSVYAVAVPAAAHLSNAAFMAAALMNQLEATGTDVMVVEEAIAQPRTGEPCKALPATQFSMTEPGRGRHAVARGCLEPRHGADPPIYSDQCTS